MLYSSDWRICKSTSHMIKSSVFSHLLFYRGYTYLTTNILISHLISPCVTTHRTKYTHICYTHLLGMMSTPFKKKNGMVKHICCFSERKQHMSLAKQYSLDLSNGIQRYFINFLVSHDSRKFSLFF